MGEALKRRWGGVGARTLVGRRLKEQAWGLWGCVVAGGAALTPVVDGPANLPTHRPLLVFRTGTMSSMSGSVGDLWSSADGDGGRAGTAARRAIGRKH